MTEDQKKRLKERFFAMVSKTPNENGCREWLGYVRPAPNDYGMFELCEGGEASSELAHRVAFAIGTDDFSILKLYGGGGKNGPVVRHGDKCRKRCVEFSHLSAGTHRDNIDDNARTGKLLRGEAVGTSKLDDDTVLEILAAYAAWPKSEKTGKPKRGVLERLSEQHGVTRQMIWQIVHGKWWKHLQ